MKKWYEKRQVELRERGNKGFTLMEMLIVVAIIAVLVAIAIPVFTSQLEKSREGTDAANIRNAYAENMVAILEDPDSATMRTSKVSFQQQQDGWQNTDISDSLSKLSKTNTDTNGDLDVSLTGTPTAGGSAEFEYSKGTTSKNPKLTITIG